MLHVSPAEDIAAAKVAVLICNNPKLKREILCALGSNYDINSKHGHVLGTKLEWDRLIEKEARRALENLGLTKQLHEKVIGIIISIGMRMLTWASYHENILGLSREQSVNFLNSSFFTPQGIIDNRKAAEELIKGKGLTITQQYVLACLYCFSDRISSLFKQMTKEDKKEFCDAQKPERIKQQGLVKFWSYYLMGEIDKLMGGKELYEYGLEKAIESRCKAAVEYCLGKINVNKYKGAIIDAALEIVKYQTTERDDLFVFRKARVHSLEEGPFNPSDYHMEILCLLLSKMSEDQRIEFLKKDIENSVFDYPGDFRQSRVLTYFLNWPYQDYFMKTAKLLMWEFLPERCYADLLLKICYKFESEMGCVNYGVEKTFSYRKLFTEFWQQSPESYKRYVLNDDNKDIFAELFSLKNITYEDRNNIEVVLASATDVEKENIITSDIGEYICIFLITKAKWKILDEFIRNCFTSKEQSDEFKRVLSLKRQSFCMCVSFLSDNKWDRLESFFKWSGLSEKRIIQYKKKMIAPLYVLNVYEKLFCHNRVEDARKFINGVCLMSKMLRNLKNDRF